MIPLYLKKTGFALLHTPSGALSKNRFFNNNRNRDPGMVLNENANLLTPRVKQKSLGTLILLCSVGVVTFTVPALAQDNDAIELPDFDTSIEMNNEVAPAEEPAMEAAEPIIPLDAQMDEPLQPVEEVPPVNNMEETAAEDTTQSAPELAVTEEEAPAMPEAEGLEEPVPENLSINEGGAEQFNDDTYDENIFYDAEELVPQGELAKKGGPRKVDPRVEPGSRLIVVRKNHSASSHKAGLIAAQRAIKLGRYGSALELYNDLYEKSKKDPAILMGRAVAYQHLGQNDMAVQAYEQLLEIRPKDVNARVNMLGIIGQRYPNVALRQLEELRAENRENVGVVAQLAVVHAAMENYKDAIRYLGVAASMEPHNASHIMNMAVIADRSGARKEAVKYYEQALEVDTLYGKGASIPRDTVFERLAQLR